MKKLIVVTDDASNINNWSKHDYEIGSESDTLFENGFFWITELNGEVTGIATRLIRKLRTIDLIIEKVGEVK